MFSRARLGAGEAVAAERADQGAGDDADTPMAELVYVIHRQACRLGVVDMHARHAKRRAELAGVHDRRMEWRRGLDEAGGLPRQPMSEEDQSIGVLAAYHLSVALFTALVVLRVAEQYRVAFALGGVLDPLQEERKERVGNVGNGD